MKEDVQKKSMIAAIANGMERVLEWVSIIFIVLLTINMIMAVFFRYILSDSIFWADELSLVLFAWLTFLGGSLAVKRSEMAAVTLFLSRLPDRTYRMFSSLIQILIIIFSGVLGYYSYLWISSPSVVNMMSSTLPMSMWIIYLIVPISMVCIIVFAVDNIRKIYTKQLNEEGGFPL
ncbi:TRAP transporter small permease [Alteribacillus sp. YIM 98480]|uniref:TRAP transporter small permease n=1 Tax=Alteribacillus sp. YIM 98480 TaxID=2606599 RepID=UPI00131D671E|nr:TRAP transporter small permease [Alteribacillus sp. YIM 98480]